MLVIAVAEARVLLGGPANGLERDVLKDAVAAAAFAARRLLPPGLFVPLLFTEQIEFRIQLVVMRVDISMLGPRSYNDNHAFRDDSVRLIRPT